MGHSTCDVAYIPLYASSAGRRYILVVPTGIALAEGASPKAYLRRLRRGVSTREWDEGAREGDNRAPSGSSLLLAASEVSMAADPAL